MRSVYSQNFKQGPFKIQNDLNKALSKLNSDSKNSASKNPYICVRPEFL